MEQTGLWALDGGILTCGERELRVSVVSKSILGKILRIDSWSTHLQKIVGNDTNQQIPGGV